MTKPPHSEISNLALGSLCAMADKAPWGSFVEIGVYKGGSAYRLYEITEKQERTLYLYDTFTGMPFAGEMDGNAAGRFRDCSYMDVMALMPNAVVRPGIFPDSLGPMYPIAFVPPAQVASI